MHCLNSVSGTVVDLVCVRRALLSVFDKTGLLDLAQVLVQHGVELLSTGGTAKALRDAGFNVRDVSEYTQSNEMLDGRVKTLHPRVHGGLLYVRGNEQHESDIISNGIQPIDLVIINLYPFSDAVAKGSHFNTCVENIDIGGPSMLRSAAKNHAYVSVVTSPTQYSALSAELVRCSGSVSLQTRRRLASAAFALSAQYDASVAKYFASQVDSEHVGDELDLTKTVIREYSPALQLKYGCNPHQQPAAVLRCGQSTLPFEVLNGNPGYINLLDALNAWQLVSELAQSTGLVSAASFKHVSPAGAALAVPLTSIEREVYELNGLSFELSDAALAYARARNADPMCSFGDFAALSHKVDLSTALLLKTEVCDGIIAPDYDDDALQILRQKKKGSFVVLKADASFVPPAVEFREVFGACFAQKRNDTVFGERHLQQIVVGDSLNSDAQRDLILASIALKYTQSNSVCYARGGQVLGVGAGQQSRVDCVKLAGRKTETWFLRQHPKVRELRFLPSVKRQERVNARVRYIEGDFSPAELPVWQALFEVAPEPLTAVEKTAFLQTLSGVSISSDAFFPFRDSIDVASKFGVQFVAQPGGSVADHEVKTACAEYGMSMAFTNLRLFHH